jgi:hypothetical protein
MVEAASWNTGGDVPQKRGVDQRIGAARRARKQRKIQMQLTDTLYPKLSAAQIAVTQAENALANQLHIVQSELAKLNQLRDRFEGTSFLESLGDVELDSIQKKGIWNHPDLDRVRSRLFAAALQLHESWLAGNK